MMTKYDRLNVLQAAREQKILLQNASPPDAHRFDNVIQIVITIMENLSILPRYN